MAADLFSNQFHRVRAMRLAEATREFNARGKSVVRCDLCLLANYACICPWRKTLNSRCEFILLMHREEVFKPTNTGRLIADLLPQKTHVFCWSRTEPPQALLNLLQDSSRRCMIVFPAEAADSAARPRELIKHLPDDDKINCFILLDGTWKQSGRMFHLSRWLDTTPCVVLPESSAGNYAVRQAHQEHYLSTAEAAALCLVMADEAGNAVFLQDYFQLFNEHYLATRGSYVPQINELHQRLESWPD